jgi:TolB-like protein
VVDTAGDGLLAAFPSAIRGVECAVAIQKSMGEFNAPLTEDRRMEFRIGIDLGDVIDDGSGIYGEGVNIAARLQALSAPGGVALSGAAHDQVEGKLALAFEPMGEQTLRNIARPVRVYRIVDAADGHSGAGAPAVPDAPSIAVLPFSNLSADPDQEFFSDGITEDITTALCRLKGFFVIARNTMFTFKGKAVDIRAVGRELGVRYVLEGSVRKAGDSIRVAAQLIDAATGSHLWGERYDRRLDDIFAIQDEITASVVGRIGPELLAAEYARASRKLPQNLDAWECTIRALFLGSRLSGEASLEALALLDRAIAADHGYAQALGLKVWVRSWRAFQGWDDLDEMRADIRSLAARAIAADEDEPWSWVGRGVLGLATLDNATAMGGLTRAVELNPNFAFGLGLLSLAHSFGGRSAEALACLDRAVRLSPRELFRGSFAQQYAFACFQGALYEQALEYAEQAHAMRPGHPYTMIIGSASAGHLGRRDATATMVANLKAMVPHITRAWIEETAPYVQAEDRRRLGEGLRLAGLD